MVQVFPRVAPVQGTMTLAKLQDEDPHIQAGEGRTLADQALMQLLGNTALELSTKFRDIWLTALLLGIF